MNHMRGINPLKDLALLDVVHMIDRETAAVIRDEGDTIAAAIRSHIRETLRTRGKASGFVVLDAEGVLGGRQMPMDENVAHLTSNGFRVWNLHHHEKNKNKNAAGTAAGTATSIAVSWSIESAATVLECTTDEAGRPKFSRCVEVTGPSSKSRVHRRSRHDCLINSVYS